MTERHRKTFPCSSFSGTHTPADFVIRRSARTQLSTATLVDPTSTTTEPTPVRFVQDRAPGVALMAFMALLVRQIPRFLSGTPILASTSPMLWAMLLGLIYGNCFLYSREQREHGQSASVQERIFKKGIQFTKTRLLRLGIILYGGSITSEQVMGSMGAAGLAVNLIMVASTLSVARKIGPRWFGLDTATSTLMGSGAAICGCSAVLATQPVIECRPHQVSAAVGTVVLGGTLSMLLYPALYRIVPCLAASPQLMGIYTGSTMHEMAGVMAASSAMSSHVVDLTGTAVVTKLVRILLLAPTLTVLSRLRGDKQRNNVDAIEPTTTPRKSKVVFPWFTLGFLAVSALHSVLHFPSAFTGWLRQASSFCLLCTMTALGMESNLYEIRQLGRKPLYLTAVLWLWLTVGGLGVARLVTGL